MCVDSRYVSAPVRSSPMCIGMCRHGTMHASVFVVNPAYSIVLGLRCGRDFRRMWYMPLVSSVAFLVGSWVFFDIREPWFVVYAAVYFVLGMVAAAISARMVKQ